MTKLDIDFVRAQFPAFSQPSLDGHAFFANAGGGFAWIIGAALGAIIHLAISQKR